MKVSIVIGLSVLSSFLLMVGCQSSEPAESSAKQEEQALEREHDHNHAHEEDTQQIYNGYFEDQQVMDRPLSDWEGEWQSVYPYLLDGTLDEVFSHKAENKDTMTEEQYKRYYEVGYQTDVERISIKGNHVKFIKDGKEYSGEYVSDGYEILTYDAGNRGVRYIFKLTEEKEELPSFIQFSDHIISPKESDHYHLYWGNDRSDLLEEVTNWPTFYPAEMGGQDIANDMMNH